MLEFDRELTYEEKMWLLGVIQDRVDRIKQMLILKRVNVEKKCPHHNTFNMTTLADPANVKKELCADCGNILIYEDGILKEVKER